MSKVHCASIFGMYSVRENPPKHIRDELQMYDDFTQRFLYARSITTERQAEVFLRKEWLDVNAHQYKSIQKAVRLLLETVKARKPIGIFSDYDCDGIPAAAALFSTLNALGHTDIVYCVPDRNTEGFGINRRGIEKMVKNGVAAVCVLDCGTAQPKEIAKLEEAGIRVIILDHHLSGETVPNAFALINPHLEADVHEPHPCAAGLVYIFIQELIQEAQNMQIEKKPRPGWEKWQLDIIGMATLSDMVPLHGINRQIVHYGLQVFRKSPRPGIQALCNALNINQQKATQDDLSFLIIPRINAASRMGKAETAFTLLTTDNMDEAMALTEEVTALNNKRKTAVATMTRLAHKQAKNKDKEKQVWVFGNREWKPSLVGLVAQKMSESYGKSVFVWGQSEAVRAGETGIKGSCRSKRHDLFSLMQKLPDMFTEAGGHRNAGGFTLTTGVEVELEDRLNTIAQEAEDDSSHIEVDGEYSVSEVISHYKMYEQLSPFGMKNEPIVVAMPGCQVHRQVKFGKNKDHTRYTFADKTGRLEGISFFTEDNRMIGEEYTGEVCAVVGQVEFDSYRNSPRIRVIAIGEQRKEAEVCPERTS